jgi:hypothetical protein
MNVGGCDDWSTAPLHPDLVTYGHATPGDRMPSGMSLDEDADFRLLPGAGNIFLTANSDVGSQ